MPPNLLFQLNRDIKKFQNIVSERNYDIREKNL